LDYAHRHGVIHRDIKPENVLLHDGSALVADFGIALAVSGPGVGSRMTETGMSLGTPQYMSPEQAMGEREITARSDVYALGVVCYEMLIGEPPFTGPTAQAIVAKVMTAEPAGLIAQRKSVPPAVEDAVLTALQKLPADRFGTAAGFADALTGKGRAGEGRSPAHMSARSPVRRTARYAAMAFGGGLVLGAVLTAVVRPSSPEPKVTRYRLALPPSQAPIDVSPVTASPDGGAIAYIGPAPNQAVQLWIKRRDRADANPLAGTEGVANFVWSPDGQSIAFTQAQYLKRVPVLGGPVATLSDSASTNPGLTWLDDGTIVGVLLGGARGLMRIPAAGGKMTVLLHDSLSVAWPTALPGSRGILYTRCRSTCTASQEIWAYDLRSGATHIVVAGALLAHYFPSGQLAYIRPDGAIMAARFNLATMRTEGVPVPIVDSVMVVNGAFPSASFSESGTLTLRRGSPRSAAQQYQMVWVDRAGHQTPIDPAWTFRMTNFGANYGWAISPDGSKMAIGLATDAGDDIWVKQLPRGPLSRVSYDSAADFRPRWTQDGLTVFFASNRSALGVGGGLYARRADGTGSDSLLWRADGGIFEAQWSPDRRWLLFRTGGIVGLAGGRDIVGIRPGVDSAPVPIVATAFDEEAIALSPDGHWLAYESNETGQTEVFLRPFPATDSGKWQISNGGGVAPLWARNSKELFFVSSAGDMMAEPIASAAKPRGGPPRMLFHLADDLYMSATEFYTPFDVAPDGRFIMAVRMPLPPQTENPLIVVDNWLEELKAKVGSR
ncbi:MAG: protein kinase, partial [Gemmatimonadota bacterium]